MIEGQEGVGWDDWVALADACERSGVEALFRSDHYVSVMGEGEPSGPGGEHTTTSRTPATFAGTTHISTRTLH